MKVRKTVRPRARSFTVAARLNAASEHIRLLMMLMAIGIRLNAASEHIRMLMMLMAIGIRMNAASEHIRAATVKERDRGYQISTIGD